ncbi:MAG: helix-turn-helix transcriptional regulator [Actinobacteria bacterium]|nr:helix-turn-helix transcriptional regulator [Actinomycetota bacterium]MCB9390893.1 helix-turn-helix transcriptional regulator [Acidimicrobiia bacterium]
MTNAIAKRLAAIQHDGGISGRDIANLIDTTPQTISRWRNGQSSPQSRYLERILSLEWLVAQLSEYYPADEAKLWIFSPHPLLQGERPADRIAAGRTDDVLRLVDQLDSAAYI